MIFSGNSEILPLIDCVLRLFNVHRLIWKSFVKEGLFYSNKYYWTLAKIQVLVIQGRKQCKAVQI